MAFQLDFSPLQRVSAAQVLPGIGANIRQGIDQKQAQQQMQAQQQQMQEVLRGAYQGDPDALENLFALNPQLSIDLQNLEAERLAKFGKEQKQIADRKNYNYARDYKFASPAEKRSIVMAAIEDPESDLFDESDLNASEEKLNFDANAALFTRLGKDGYKALVSEGELSASKQADIDIRREANEIRRLENQERSLDRQVKRETNELKKRELEAKLAENQKNREQKQRDLTSQADNAVATFDQALGTIDRIVKSEGFGAAVGARIPFLDQLPGSDAQETIGLIDTLQSQTFLNQIEKMKGLGSLSNAEGAKVSAAIGSLNRDMSEEAFKRSLESIRGFLEKGKNAAKKKYGIEDTPAEIDSDNLSDEELLQRYGG